MARNIQKIHTYRFDSVNAAGKPAHQFKPEIIGTVRTDKSSFGTLDKAIKDAYFWINKEADWIDTTVVEITIINKETNEVLWSYKA